MGKLAHPEIRERDLGLEKNQISYLALFRRVVRCITGCIVLLKAQYLIVHFEYA